MMHQQAGPEGTKPLIAILNATQASIDVLQSIIEHEGFTTIADFIVDFREGRKDLAAFFKAHQPKAVVYDIGPPYIQNWTFFKEHVLALQVLPEQSFILITTNKMVLDLLVGPTTTIELVGKPVDSAEIVQALRKAVHATFPKQIPGQEEPKE
jgi:CheY-like chemotaxis protein